MKKLFVRAFVLWIPFVVAITGIFGFSYLAVQQNYRQSVNDPQIQMAEAAALSLAQVDTPASVVPRGVAPTDISKSLDTWIAVYDASGTPLESTAVLDGAPPKLPQGLLDPTTWTALKTFTAPTGVETHVTWQPRPEVRQAVVIVQFPTPQGVGYVAVGRSMRVLEDRIINLTQLAAVAWSTTVLAVLGAIFIVLFLGW